MSGLTPFIIVPVKPLNEGKSRLSGVLSDAERKTLNRSFLTHTLTVVREVPGAAQTIVVSRDGDVLAEAAALGAHAVAEPGNAGLNAALAAARTEAVTLGATALLVLPVDLPLLSPADIAALIADPGASPCVRIAPDESGPCVRIAPDESGPCVRIAPDESGPCVRIAPDESGGGTNALYLAPPGAIGFHFGHDSFAAHAAAARGAGLAPDIVQMADIAFDVDTPDDYARLRRLERLRPRPIAAFVTTPRRG